MFDCVMPTRNARNGMLFTAQGTLNIKNKKWENDFSPIDAENYCYVDVDYSKAYLRHLFTVNEMLGKQIATLHNLGFYMWLVREARKHILAGDFSHGKIKCVVKWIIDCKMKIVDWYIIKKYLSSFCSDDCPLFLLGLWLIWPKRDR